MSTQKKILSLTILLVSDCVVVLLSYWVAYLIRSELLPEFMANQLKTYLPPFTQYLKYFAFAGTWILIFAYEKLYTKRYPFWEEIKVLVKSTSIASLTIMIMIFIARRQIQFSRTIVITAWVISLFLFPIFRLCIKTLLVKTHLWKKKLLLIGVQKTSLLVLKNIQQNTTMGYEVLGFLDDDPEKIGKTFSGIEVIGPVSQLEEITKAYGSKDIMIAIPHLPRKELDELLNKCEALSDSMWIIPRSGDFITAGVELEILGEVLTLSIKKNLAKPWNKLLKYVFEMVLTTVLSIILLPVFAVIALAIKLSSKGPVIFKQSRIGQGKKTFVLPKFRSMYEHNDQKLEEYIKTHPHAGEEWRKYRKIKGYDPRVTTVGKFLRRFSLDELPQLFSIIQGKMSLVGPRPYLPEELEGKATFRDKIAVVKPGITGLWQTSGRSEVKFEKRMALDEYYIRNWSLWLDITILLKSVKVWLSRKGAY
ncbi:MAG: sugar transferase [Candidatus Aminicenantes bacterium]|nr:sugar transferase [Candidatus Aminicenantes bacterium]